MSAHDRDQLLDLAAAAALAPLSVDEQAVLETALKRDPSLAAEALAYRTTVQSLAQALPRVAAPGGGFDAVLARIESPPAGLLPEDAPATAPPQQGRVIPFVRRRPVVALVSAASFAAAAAILLTLVLVGGSSTSASTVTVAAPMPTTGAMENAAVSAEGPAAGVGGRAAIYQPQAGDEQLIVRLTGVPDAPSGHFYQVWVLPVGSKQMVPVGAFAHGGTVTMSLPLPPGTHYAAVDISVQPMGGPPAHSGVSLAGGKFA